MRHLFSSKKRERKKKFKSHIDLFKMESINKKETKSPAKSKLENKSLRKKLGRPAGLKKRN